MRNFPNKPRNFICHGSAPLDTVVILCSVASDVSNFQSEINFVTVFQSCAFNTRAAFIYSHFIATFRQFIHEQLLRFRTVIRDAAFFAFQHVKTDAFVVDWIDRQVVLGIFDQRDPFISSFRSPLQMFFTADDVQIFTRAQQSTVCLFFRQVQFSFQAQDTTQSISQTFFRDDAVLVTFQHEAEVLFDVVEEQEHIAAGSDRFRNVIFTAHSGRHTQHVRCIRDDQAVEA